MAYFPNNDPETRDQMRSFMGPGQVDHMIRQAIQLAWVMLPDDRKTVVEVERVIRQVVDRALEELRQDADTFSLGS
jgi:hypothetical protein